MNTNVEAQIEQIQALNTVLLEMNKSQREANKALIRSFIITIICMTTLLVSMIIGFFWYESQFQVTEKVVTETITQEVSGTDSEINNVEGNMYKDNSVHNQERGD